MAIPLMKDIPLSPPADLGPYRRKDYEALPDEPRCELIYGRFYVSPSPLVLHQLVVGLLFEKLRQIARTVGARVFVAPLDVHLADHSIVQPDILYISAARREIVQGWIEGAPDLLVEVLSPGTARRDRYDKLQLYGESGIREYWLIDPRERQIEFLRNVGSEFVVTLPQEGWYKSQVMPEIHLDLEAFWREIEAELAG